MPERAFISLGSNIEPAKHLPLGAARLGELGRVAGFSTVYQNPAIGPRPQPDFLNASALVLTDLAALDVYHALRGIESELGRMRSADRYAPRTIDLDLCLFGGLVLETEELRLPDPDILSRAYLAMTLAELDPFFIHPISGERLHVIAARLAPGNTLVPHPDIVL